MEVSTILLPGCGDASVFNPAMIVLDDGRILMCCRCIQKSRTIRHPWHWWVPHVGVCSAPVDGVVFESMSQGGLVPWVDPDRVENITDGRYHDTTIFYLMDSAGRCIAKTPMTTDNVMIDARLARVRDGSIIITYTFSQGDERNQMRWRRIEGITDAGILLGDEMPLLDDFPSRQISEKNCVAVQGTDDVLYEIRSTLSAFRSNDTTTLIKGPPIPWFQRLRDMYGVGIVEVSLGAPPMRTSGDRYMGAGHIKVLSNRAGVIRGGGTPLGRFLDDFHNQPKKFWAYNYYFMFFYEFSLTTLEVLRMSHAFIPTGTDDDNRAEPYLLVFPMSIHSGDHDSTIVVFGEGDDRCKMMRIEAPLMDALWCPPDADMEFMLLHASECAFATVLTTQSYLPGVIALRNSLEAVGSRYPLVCLVVPGVDAPPGVHSLSVDAIPHPFMKGYYKEHNYTKLRLFGLERFDRIVYLDADTIVRKNIDWMFDIPCRTTVSAVPDAWNPAQFNSGVMIIDRPSHHILDDMLDKVGKIEKTTDEGDQGFLRPYFGDRWTSLSSPEFNWCVGKDKPVYDDVSVLHFVGQQKPWSSFDPTNEAHALWLRAFSSN